MALTTPAANRARSFSVAPPKAFLPTVGSFPEELVDQVTVGAVDLHEVEPEPTRRLSGATKGANRVGDVLPLMAIPRGSFGALRPDGLSIGPGGSHLASGTTTAPTCQICGPIAPPAACTSLMTRPQP